jgi:hypothetical protein
MDDTASPVPLDRLQPVEKTPVTGMSVDDGNGEARLNERGITPVLEGTAMLENGRLLADAMSVEPKLLDEMKAVGGLLVADGAVAMLVSIGARLEIGLNTLDATMLEAGRAKLDNEIPLAGSATEALPVSFEGVWVGVHIQPVG